MSDFLIDTHTLLWFIEADPRLSDRARNVLMNDSINLSVSVVSADNVFGSYEIDRFW